MGTNLTICGQQVCITFGTGAGAPVPQPLTIACLYQIADGPGTESGEARLFQKKVQIVKQSKQFPQACANSQTRGKCGERRAEPGAREFGNLPGRIIEANEDGTQGNINIYENIRT